MRPSGVNATFLWNTGTSHEVCRKKAEQASVVFNETFLLQAKKPNQGSGLKVWAKQMFSLTWRTPWGNAVQRHIAAQH